MMAEECGFERAMLLSGLDLKQWVSHDDVGDDINDNGNDGDDVNGDNGDDDDNDGDYDDEVTEEKIVRQKISRLRVTKLSVNISDVSCGQCYKLTQHLDNHYRPWISLMAASFIT